ncbi:hypothetical protein P5673_017880 [Acropora cervicornis]|uniref:Uncharacterized protein n=1 Tax=Acropora cervicornis TaxID=6130 RepID=A0AAD9QEH2_ACRCE|nr:hypothetical protein P5673_017880 [Acropora cervicornis]
MDISLKEMCLIQIIAMLTSIGRFLMKKKTKKERGQVPNFPQGHSSAGFVKFAEPHVPSGERTEPVNVEDFTFNKTLASEELVDSEEHEDLRLEGTCRRSGAFDFRIRTCKNEKNNVTKQEIDESSCPNRKLNRNFLATTILLETKTAVLKSQEGPAITRERSLLGTVISKGKIEATLSKNQPPPLKHIENTLLPKAEYHTLAQRNRVFHVEGSGWSPLRYFPVWKAQRLNSSAWPGSNSGCVKVTVDKCSQLTLNHSFCSRVGTNYDIIPLNSTLQVQAL